MPPSSPLHPAACSCCSGPAPSRLDRRRFLRFSAGAGMAAAFPAPAAAEDGEFEVMLLMCSDPRIGQPTIDYMANRGLAGKYRPFVAEGGAIAIVAEQYKDWRQAFWDELSAAVTWHNVQKIITLDHRDCAAARIAYGLAKTADKLIETEMHRYALKEFSSRVAERHAGLDVEIGLMALDGKVQIMG